VSANDRRTLLTAVPSFQYRVTERWGFGVQGIVQTVDYSGSNAANQYVPYNYYSGTGSLNFGLTPRSDIALQAFASRTRDKNDDGKSNAHGLGIQYDHRWATNVTGRLDLSVERDDITTVLPRGRDKSTNPALTYTTHWKRETDQFDFAIGRTYTPGGLGGTYSADQVQVQYQRNVSPRTTIATAARYTKYKSVANSLLDRGYDYVTFFGNLRYRVTPTWYISTDLEYRRATYERLPGAADNFRAAIAFGYQGLTR
jgi:hypothetical protein